jgi:hypothetical protein
MECLSFALGVVGLLLRNLTKIAAAIFTVDQWSMACSAG